MVFIVLHNMHSLVVSAKVDSRGCNSASSSSLFNASRSWWISITLHINFLLFILTAITSQPDNANRRILRTILNDSPFRRNRPQIIETNFNNCQAINVCFFFPLNNKIVSFNFICISFRHLAALKCEHLRLPFF